MKIFINYFFLLISKVSIIRNFSIRVLEKVVNPNSNKTGLGNEINRAIWLKNTLANIPDGSRILDAGAGEQQFKGFCNHLNYVSQDIAEYNGEGDIGLQTGTWDFGKLDIISDIIDIPEPAASFDAIICTEVLEHIPNPDKVFPEFSRLIKSGGTLIITAPFCSLTHFAPNHYSTGFNKFYYEEHLLKNGFVISEISPNGNYFEYLAQELRRVQKVSKSYTHFDINRLDNLSISLLLDLMNKLSNEGAESSELLCFGYHVIAKKK
jgi:SAM-dependent methyltransferase